MRPNTGRALALAGVAAAVLAAAFLSRGPSGRAAAPAGSGSGPSAGAAGRAGVTSASGAIRAAGLPDTIVGVNIDALGLPRPKLVEATRDPFRFKPKPPPPRPPASAGAGGGRGASSGTPVPSAPPPPPPIPLKFIGIVDGARGVGKLAVLSDGRAVSYGREGETIEGRYRIIRIGAESVEIAYADGRGRQTIRLTGQ
jgi:hypothetical protein